MAFEAAQFSDGPAPAILQFGLRGYCYGTEKVLISPNFNKVHLLLCAGPIEVELLLSFIHI